MTSYWRCEKSGWTRNLLPLSDHSFARLDHEISGVPIYINKGRVWPKPVPGITLILEETSS